MEEECATLRGELSELSKSKALSGTEGNKVKRAIFATVSRSIYTTTI